MLHGILDSRSRPYTVLLAVLTALFVLCILLFPDRAFQSSLQGLSLWWNIVFPALLPFLILSELLGGFGFIRGAGVLLDPVMKLLFRLPGAGGWAVAMGSLAGGPTGAHLAGQLRSEGTVSREQGERILALSHMSSPFLIMSVIGAAFLHQPAAGTVIAAVHYTSALCAAFVMRFRWKREQRPPTPVPTPEERKRFGFEKGSKKPPSIWVRCIQEMHEARLKDGRSFGKLLSDAVSNSIQTLLLVGGCIIMFSVMLHALQLSMVTPIVNSFLFSIIQLAGFPNSGTPDWLPSLLELHLGTYSFSQLNLAASALVWKAALIGFALGWSGISQHLQVQSIVRHTDLRYLPFLVHRFVHGCIAFVLTFVLWKPLQMLAPRIQPSFLRADSDPSAGTEAVRSAADALSAWQAVPGRLEELVGVFVVVVLLSGIIGFVRSRLRGKSE